MQMNGEEKLLCACVDNICGCFTREQWFDYLEKMRFQEGEFNPAAMGENESQLETDVRRSDNLERAE